MHLEQQAIILRDRLLILLDRIQKLQLAIWSIGSKVGEKIIMISLWILVICLLFGGGVAFADHTDKCDHLPPPDYGGSLVRVIDRIDYETALRNECIKEENRKLDIFTSQNPELFSADAIIKAFSDQARAWTAPIIKIATAIFWSLAVIELILTFSMMAIRGSELREFTVELLKRILIISFGAFLLATPGIFFTMVDGFRDTASIVLTGQAGNEMTIEQVLQIPLDLAALAYRAAKGLSPTSDFMQIAMIVVTAIIILWAMAISCGQLIVVLCEMYAALTIGLLSLGFFSLSITREYPMRFFGGVFAIGFKLFAIELIISVGVVMAQSWSNMPIMHEAGPYMMMAASALIYKEIAVKVPDYIQSLLTASPGSGVSAQGAVTGAMAVGGAGVAAAALGKEGSARLIGAGQSVAAAAGRYSAGFASAPGKAPGSIDLSRKNNPNAAKEAC